MNVKIPFGINRAWGHFEDAHQALRGRACDCVCPSCHAPLVCKKPQTKVAHFAHDSKSTDSQLAKDCELSFAVSLAMMARNALMEWRGRVMQLPECRFQYKRACCGQNVSLPVRPKQSVVIDSLQLSTVAGFDLVAKIAGHSLYLRFTYSSLQPFNVDDSIIGPRAGVVLIDCDQFDVSAYQQQTQVGFRQAVVEFVFGERWMLGDSHRWLYHPESEAKKRAHESKHKCISEEYLRFLASSKTASGASKRPTKPLNVLRRECSKCFLAFDAPATSINSDVPCLFCGYPHTVLK